MPAEHRVIASEAIVPELAHHDPRTLGDPGCCLAPVTRPFTRPLPACQGGWTTAGKLANAIDDFERIETSENLVVEETTVGRLVDTVPPATRLQRPQAPIAASTAWRRPADADHDEVGGKQRVPTRCPDC